MKGFSVTYDIVTPESAEDGDFAESGFVAEGLSLREAIDLVSGPCEADSYPITRQTAPRWLTFYEYDQDYATGAIESRALHIPESTTPSSRLRIARLFRVYRFA